MSRLRAANLTAGELAFRRCTSTEVNIYPKIEYPDLGGGISRNIHPWASLVNPPKEPEIVPPILTCRALNIFLCRTETLSVLLDYRSEDNKEGTFEVGFP